MTFLRAELVAGTCALSSRQSEKNSLALTHIEILHKGVVVGQDISQTPKIKYPRKKVSRTILRAAV